MVEQREYTEKNEKQQDSERLTVLQVQCLAELERMGIEKRQGLIQEIADKCGTARPNVSRFFKSCVEKGYLTKEFAFTEKGRRIYEWNRRFVEEVKEYLIGTGIREGLDDFVKALVDHVDYAALKNTISTRPTITEGSRMQAQQNVIADINSILHPGRHKVKIGIFQINSSRRPRKSMADRGFEPYGELVCTGEERYLELTVKEMHARSRVNSEEMFGHLASLKYLLDETMHTAGIENGKVRIPLEACTYENFDHGIIWGNVMITVACSVGEVHMPESTARLLFII